MHPAPNGKQLCGFFVMSFVEDMWKVHEKTYEFPKATSLRYAKFSMCCL